MNLADQLSAYAVKLLDKVRGHKELDCVLGKTGKETEEKYLLLARLYLAIKYEEKPVSGKLFRSEPSAFSPERLHFRLVFDQILPGYEININKRIWFFLFLVRCSLKLSTKTGGNLA